jgi:hypothetical protein
MPGINSDLVRQGEKLCVYAIEQLFVISSGHVSAANAVVKEHVSAQEYSVFFVVKSDVSRRMPGHKKYYERLNPECDDIPFFQESVRRLVLIVVEAVAGGIDLHSSQRGFLHSGYKQVYFEGFLDKFISQNVVDMAMGIEQ